MKSSIHGFIKVDPSAIWNKKFFLYTRVSDTKYADSILDQKKMLIERAKQAGIKEKNIEIIEEKKSGYKAGREQFNKMITILNQDADIHKNYPENRIYWGILFWKVDRLARNYKEFGMLEDLLDVGYEFISSTEVIEASYTGRLLFRILAGFAIYESEKNSSRQAIKKMSMFFHNGIIGIGKISKFGYQVIKHTASKKVKDVIINEDQANVVRLIYTTYLSEYKKWKKGKGIYKAIGKELQTKHLNEWLILDAYIKGTTKDIEDLISDIIENDGMINYSGLVRYKVDVKDGIVSKFSEELYWDSLWPKNSKNIVLTWTSKISGQVNFSFYDDKLNILPPITIEEVEFTKDKRVKTPYIWVWLFTGLVVWKSKDGKIMYASAPRPHTSKHTYNYRVSINGKEAQISEIKLEKHILESKALKDWEKVFKNKKLLNSFVSDKLETDHISEKRRLNMYKIVYTYRMDVRENELSMLDPTDIDYRTNKLKLESEKQAFKKELEATEQAIDILNNKKLDIMQTIETLSQRWLKALKHNSPEAERRLRSIVYRICIDKITIEQWPDSTKKVTVTLDKEACKSIYWKEESKEFQFIIGKND